MAETKPRIFIGSPCYGQVDPAILEDWMRFAYHLGRRMPEYDFVLGIKTKSEQFRARNAIVDAALQSDCEWTLMIDDDMVINHLVTTGPTEEYGFVEKLIAHNKDICGVLYYQRNGECAPVLMTKVGEGGYRFLRDDEIVHGLQRVDVAGGGCLLIRTRIFDRLKYPYFEPEFKFGTDIQLCRQAAEKGFEVWADTSIELGHLRTEKVVVTGRNRLQYQMIDQLPGEMKKTFVAAEIHSRLIADAEAYTGETRDSMMREAMTFIHKYEASGLTDADWYRQYPKERVWRQVIFNTERDPKRVMTEFILSAIDSHKKLDILDFGCGIGLTAFALAEKGHRVTALDIRGTGTLEFLKWRASKYKVPIAFLESEGGPPRLDGRRFDVVIAMDSIEHIDGWPETVARLADAIKTTGILFSNNGILDDNRHPEHYDIKNKEFLTVCMEHDLMPFNEITFRKQEQRHAENTDSNQNTTVHAAAR